MSIFLRARAWMALLLLFALAAPPLAAQEAAEAPVNETTSLLQDVDGFFGVLVGHMSKVLFAEVPVPGRDEGGIPLIIIVLVAGGIFFTVRYGFINLLLFRHAIDVVRGRYDDPNDAGEITHFQALTSALAATVGLGNIAGVAVAITAGGPGAIFWMWLTAFFGMSMKFSSCTLAQVYRDIKPDGHVIGGPMIYLKHGIADRVPSLWFVGALFSPIFAVLTIFAAFGGGNMFQSNQMYGAVAQVTGMENVVWFQVLFGAVLAALVALVVVGGIRRIGEVTQILVPGMCVGYCLVCLGIILVNATAVPELLASIFTQALSPEAAFGGFIGVLIQGMKRAAFSNEAGLGSAAIAHAAAKTDEPVREGVVAMLGPFIDTIVVCTMTALAILITGAHLGTEEITGIRVTAAAFESVHWILPYFLTLAVFVFAYSTLISWAYYGERATEYLFGERGLWPYRIVYALVVFAGPLLSLANVVDFADMMLLSMAFPNILGMVLISGKVREMRDDYIRRLRSGEMERNW